MYGRTEHLVSLAGLEKKSLPRTRVAALSAGLADNLVSTPKDLGTLDTLGTLVVLNVLDMSDMWDILDTLATTL